jgi:hypothetical protein
MSKIKIMYDDQPDDVVNKISAQLENFGLTIEYREGGDGFKAEIEAAKARNIPVKLVHHESLYLMEHLYVERIKPLI